MEFLNWLDGIIRMMALRSSLLSMTRGLRSQEVIVETFGPIKYMKILSYQYKNFCCKNKTTLWRFFFHNKTLHTCKTYLY